MPTPRNITVAISPELYRQTRKIATEYDTSVTEMVRFLLLVLPDAIKEARFPGGRPLYAAAAAERRQTAKTSAHTPANPPQNPQNEIQKDVCNPVKPI